MITFYTTVGTLVLRERADHTTYPIVRVGSQDYGLTPEELVLWSCLTFQILNIEELKTAYLVPGFLPLMRCICFLPNCTSARSRTLSSFDSLPASASIRKGSCRLQIFRNI